MAASTSSVAPSGADAHHRTRAAFPRSPSGACARHRCLVGLPEAQIVSPRGREDIASGPGRVRGLPSRPGWQRHRGPGLRLGANPVWRTSTCTSMCWYSTVSTPGTRNEAATAGTERRNRLVAAEVRELRRLRPARRRGHRREGPQGAGAAVPLRRAAAPGLAEARGAARQRRAHPVQAALVGWDRGHRPDPSRIRGAPGRSGPPLHAPTRLRGGVGRTAWNGTALASEAGAALSLEARSRVRYPGWVSPTSFMLPFPCLSLRVRRPAGLPGRSPVATSPEGASFCPFPPE